MTAKIVRRQGVYINDTEEHIEIDGQKVSLDDLVDKYNEATLARSNAHLDIVFTAMPGPANECVFVEVERHGRSLKVGEWIRHPDGYATLRITPIDFDAQPSPIQLQPRPTPQQVLATPIYGDDDARFATIRGYLTALLSTLWEQKENFGGKRPFGESGWEYDLYVALGRAGYIHYTEDDHGDPDQLDKPLANILIDEAIDALGAPE